jgi:hypothetical protein
LAAHQSDRRPGELPAEGVVLIGVDLELQRRMAEGIAPPPIPASSGRNYGASNFAAPNHDDLGTHLGAPNLSAEIDGAPEVGALSLSAETFGAPDFHASTPIDLGAPNIDASKFDLSDLLVRRSGSKTYVVQPVSRIEDAFTAAERDLLLWLWGRGRRLPFTEHLRLMTGPQGEGSRRMAVQAGLIYNTFKNLTRALSTKFALDIVKPEKNLPTIYAVYDPPSILERQRQAGYTGVVRKNGGGRALVNAGSGEAPRRPDLTVEELQRLLAG